MTLPWKVAVVVIGILVVYLGVRDYRQARWMNRELYKDWIEYRSFAYDPTGPIDPSKPPPPPPEFGF